MKRININIYPPDGYFFKAQDGSIIRGKSWQDVIARLRRYRIQNKLTLGNPTEAVHAQACARNPAACQDAADPATKAALRVTTLKGRVLKWIAALRRAPQIFTDEATMRARAAVCAQCPAHASIAGGCGSCKRAVAEVRLAVLGGRPQATQVAGCTVLGEDCVVNSWIEQPTSSNPELPACCWRRTTPV